MRWAAKGVDLGTTSRSLESSVSNQGQWSVGLGYDELRHNISDTFQTPQQGTMGGNSFTFPSNFGTINGGTTLVGGVVPPSARSLNATQLSAMHTEKIGTTRKNTSFNAGYAFAPALSMQFEFNRLDQTGAKLLAVPADGGVTIPGSTGTWRAEGVNIIMNPTNYKTDTFNLSLNWAGEKGHLTGGYYGSIFTDGYNSVSSQNAFTNNATGACATGGACSYQTTVMSTAPDNSLHQLNLSGGYNFTSSTKLAGGISYGRNTQNSNYITGQPEIAGTVPSASLNGLVVTTHADLKLTNQTTKDLTLTAAVKYNERDNRTTSNVYRFYAINSVATVATNQIEGAANAPYSNRRSQLELAADYRVSKGQVVRLSYELDNISRWCSSYGITTNSCLVNPGNKENKLGLDYRLKATNEVSLNAGYSISDRKADFNGDAVTPLGGLDHQAGGVDVNAQNYKGYIAYPYAARKQQLVKAGVIWQATEKLDVGLNGRYASDKYDATLGVQDGKTTGINLDATYAYMENASVGVYASRQDSDRNLKAGYSAVATDNQQTTYAALVAPTSIWTNQLKNTSDAVGLNTKHSGLLGGKLEVLGDVSYSLDNSKYSTQVPYTSGTTLCSLPAILSCGDTPDIKTKVLTVKLTGNYLVSKSGKITMGVIHQRMTSSDYFYNGEQYGYTPNRVMPTNLQAPNYSINVVAASYSYLF
jgi:MtrB/PioB family decaheme-associated outer membrane protein